MYAHALVLPGLFDMGEAEVATNAQKPGASVVVSRLIPNNANEF